MRSAVTKTVIAMLLVAGGSAAPAQSRIIYSDTADARMDIRQAIQTATREHKRILLDFGGNWCGDCQVLDIYLHQAPNDAIVGKHFVVVHVNIGHYDKNVNVAEKYAVPLKRGVPALAVLDPHGHLLYSQANGEFETMRKMDPGSVTEFLEKWKG
jgi:thiol:disulfide interchange protein